MQQDRSIGYEDGVVKLGWESETRVIECVHYKIPNVECYAAPPLFRDFANLSIVDCSVLR